MSRSRCESALEDDAPPDKTGELNTTVAIIDEVASGQGLSLAAASRLLAGEAGRPLDPSTLFRWGTRGVAVESGSRVKLECVRVGRRMMTSRAAVGRFVRAQNEPASAPAAPQQQPSPLPSSAQPRRRQRQRGAAEALDRAGI